MAHKVHLYDVKTDRNAEHSLAPVRTVALEDPQEAVRLATSMIVRENSIMAATIEADWRLCKTLPDYFALENALGKWLDRTRACSGHIGQMIEDLDYWKGRGVETPEDMAKFRLLETWEEAVHDLCGYRPDISAYSMKTPIEVLEAAYEADLRLKPCEPVLEPEF